VTEGSVSMSHSRYVEKVLNTFGMQDCKPCATPAAVVRDSPSEPRHGQPESDDSEPSAEPEVQCSAEEVTLFRSIVGSLLHLTNCTRPDLAFTVNSLSSFMQDPKKHHLVEAKRVLRYLKQSQDVSLKFVKSDGVPQVVGYCDASWGSDRESRRSITGHVFFLAGAPVVWSSRRQHTVALSATEAEYLSLSEAVKEALWLKSFLGELGVPQESITIHCDNQGALALALNPVHHARSKHYDIRTHFLREHVQSGAVKLLYCPTEVMIADIFTKPLGKVDFKRHASKLLSE
jgi:hypothetical protein